MSEYQSLLWPNAGPIQQGKKASKAPKLRLRGCEYCPLNEVKGVQKIKGTVKGKKIFVWAQSPGAVENEVGEELRGPAGKWFWVKMAEAGLKRSDCDIQNMVRCFPCDKVDGKLKMRTPTKEEIFCCSVFTDQAILKSKAKVHIVLGQIAAKQLFGKKQSGRIFWSDKLNGRVVIVDHPAYFIRGYGSPTQLQAFRDGLKAAAKFAKEEGGKFGYLKAQDYVGITDIESAQEARKLIREAAKKVRVSADLEDGDVDGTRKGLCYGFSAKPGQAWVFLLDHPLVNVPSSVREKIKEIARSLVEDKSIRKACQHGSYDVNQTPKILGYKFEGYDFDTNYSEYMRFPGRRSYALAAIATARYPDFMGFKEVVMPEAAPKGMSYDRAYKIGKLDFAKVPWEKLVLRNGADADLTKRIEISTKNEISMPLLRVYMDAAFTLERMEKNGPWFDYKQCELLGEIYPVRLQRKREKLQLMAGNPDFNPGSPSQVADVLYGTLNLPVLNKKPDTGVETLTKLAKYHAFPTAMIEWRRDQKMESTYRAAFKTCADSHGGRLFTKWWLSGTKTGRLSSGGSREGEEFITVNLQNIVGDEQAENQLVSDVRWRKLYEAWRENPNMPWYKDFLDYWVYIKFDYSQNELRFLAQQSGDPELIKVFKSGKDIHCEVGHELTAWSKEDILNDRPKRTMIKGFHFGLIYGLTVDGMVDHLVHEGVSKKLANSERVSEMYERYFERYNKVKKFIDYMRKMAEDKGYVENILGFRCPIDASGESEGGFWKNLAINAPIQGGAHQVLLICLALLQRKPEKYKLIRTPEAENHDAISTRVRLRHLFEAVKLSRELAEHDVIKVLRDEFKIDWQIPFKADIKAGFRYGVFVGVKDDMSIVDFLGKWCTENQVCQRKLWKELKKIRSENPVK